VAIQTEHPLEIRTPLGADALLLTSFRVTERLSQPFEMELDLATRGSEVDPNEILGQPVSVRLARGSHEPRWFHGIVSHFGLVAARHTAIEYRARVVPWLWLLTRTSDCRIFQEMTVPDIIMRVFRDRGFNDFDTRLFDSYRTVEFCVQYRETDFNFISRLMEQEGIFYYFAHEQDKHTLVMADSISAYDPSPGYERIPFSTERDSAPAERLPITAWRFDDRVQPGAVMLNSFDFVNVQRDLRSLSDVPKEHAHGDYEMYDYEAIFDERGDGEAYAKRRIERFQAEQREIRGTTASRGIATGRTFQLEDHPLKSQCREYLVTGAVYQAGPQQYESLASEPEPFSFTCTFTCMPADHPYRPPRATPKPMIRGPQTAIVTGPGSGVHTDEHGRVKVKFHWDRYAPGDGTDSCWVRVSQGWAGDGWGGMFMPHVGHEVIVEFLEGDPDRPIITGRVYNGQNVTPHPFPDEKYKSTIRDHYGNEIVFDATEGDEHIILRSPSHNSFFVLGKSSFKATESDDVSVTFGNTIGAFKGNTLKATVGDKLTYTQGLTGSLKLGSDVGVTMGNVYTAKFGLDALFTMGGGFSSHIGFKHAVNYSVETVTNKKSYRRTTKGDLYLDSEEQVWLSGAKDKALVKLDDEEIKLTFGVPTPRPKATEKAAFAMKLVSGAAALFSTGGTVGAGVANWVQGYSDDVETLRNKGKGADADDVQEAEDNLRDEMTRHLAAGVPLWTVAQAISAGSAATAAFLSKSDRDPQMAAEKASITINDKGIILKVGKGGPTISLLTDKLEIDMSGKPITIKNAQSLYHAQMFKIESSKFNVLSAKLKHKDADIS